MKHFFTICFLFIAIPAHALMIQIPTFDEGREANQERSADRNMATPTCETYIEWTGQNIDDVDLSVLGDRPHRILKPDSMATMDFNPDRLNINVDDEGNIITQECG